MADAQSRAGKRYASAELLRWVEALHAPHDEALEAAYRAPERHPEVPAIQIAPSEGALLALLLRLVGARKVVEIGTLVGYSALWMARALPEDGRLWTIERDPRHAALARRHFALAPYGERIALLEAEAGRALVELEAHAPFDAVFVDADKENYPRYGEWAARNLRPGGLLLADNVFLFGELLDDTPRARAMRAFHEAAREHFETVCVPTPDGMLVARRKPCEPTRN